MKRSIDRILTTHVGSLPRPHAVLDLMYTKAPVETLQRAVHIHPTVSELLPTIAIELTPLD